MTRMSVPGYEPLSRPPRVGDPVKVVVDGTIETMLDEEGEEFAVVLLDANGLGEARVTVPAEQVWNQARPDDPPGEGQT